MRHTSIKQRNLFRHLPVSLFISVILLTSCVSGPYLVYSTTDSSLMPLPQSISPSPDPAPPLPPLPAAWEVLGAAVVDVTGDGIDEWVLIVRRPWHDWPIMRWHGGTSPIADFRDREGKSCHLIVMTPGGHKVWAGSALPRPMIGLAAGDIDGDGTPEIVTLEGGYADWPRGPASRIDIWRWDVFGLVLVHRSPPGIWRQLFLRDIDDDDIVDIIVR